MKITKKTSEASVMGMVFYVVAVIFLAIAAFQIYQALYASKHKGKGVCIVYGEDKSSHI